MDREAALILGAATVLAAAVRNGAFKDEPEKRHAFLRGTYKMLAGLDQPEPEPVVHERHVPAVTGQTVFQDHILSLIDGKPYATLKRHLRYKGFTPQAYREAFGLPGDYPMVAPGYAARRSEIAKQHGLGVRS